MLSLHMVTSSSDLSPQSSAKSHFLLSGMHTCNTFYVMILWQVWPCHSCLFFTLFLHFQCSAGQPPSVGLGKAHSCNKMSSTAIPASNSLLSSFLNRICNYQNYDMTWNCFKLHERDLKIARLSSNLDLSLIPLLCSMTIQVIQWHVQGLVKVMYSNHCNMALTLSVMLS